MSTKNLLRIIPQKCCPIKRSMSQNPPLYPDHLQTSLIQKLILAGGSAAAALSDPWRADMVAVNGEVTGLPALQYMHSKVRRKYF